MTSSRTVQSRVVIDSNVWISALVFGGTPRALIEYVTQNDVKIILSEEIVSEVRRNIQQKFSVFLADFEALLVALGAKLAFVQLGTLVLDVCRDPDDNRVLETAVLGQAEVIVSGDTGLLGLGRYEGIVIVAPAAFIASLA